MERSQPSWLDGTHFPSVIANSVNAFLFDLCGTFLGDLTLDQTTPTIYHFFATNFRSQFKYLLHDHLSRS